MAGADTLPTPEIPESPCTPMKPSRRARATDVAARTTATAMSRLAPSLGRGDIERLRSAVRRRAKRPDTRIDVAGRDWEGADFSGLDLSGADFGGANLRNAQAFGTNLSGTDLRGTRLDRLAIDLGTKLRSARLPPAAEDTYVHLRVRDRAEAALLAEYGIEALADNFVCLEYPDFLRLQAYYGYRTE